MGKKVIRAAFCVAACLFASAVFFAQGTGTKSRIAVFGFLNLTGDDVFDIPAETAGKNLSFALKTIGLYTVSEPENVARNFSDSTLLKWCADNSVDVIMYGVIQLASDGGEDYRLSVFDAAKRTTTVRKTASGQSVLDVFSVSDELCASVLGAITGRRIGFGSIVFTNTGTAGNFAVSVDGVMVEGSPGRIDQVVSGTHRVRVLSGAAGTEVLSADVTVRERETVAVSFALTKDSGAPPAYLVREDTQAPKPTLVGMVSIQGGNLNFNGMNNSIDSFLIGMYEITQRQYAEVMGSIPKDCSPKFGLGDDYPVYQVSWYDAVVFCNRLSAREGLTPAYAIGGTTDTAAWGTVPTFADEAWNAVTFDSSANGYRLPMDIEWIYVARIGSKNRANKYSGGSKLDTIAWYQKNSNSRSHPVGVKEANELGLFDLSGNVSEWCQDWFGISWDDFGGHTTSRLFRGGGWDSTATECELKNKISGNPYFATNSRGFRVARRP